jgi:hypothetical protein
MAGSKSTGGMTGGMTAGGMTGSKGTGGMASSKGKGGMTGGMTAGGMTGGMTAGGMTGGMTAGGMAGGMAGISGGGMVGGGMSFSGGMAAGARGGGARGGGRGGGGRRSDIELKQEIVLLGRLANGLGFYRFVYKGSDTIYVGVIAQEVQTIKPGAVVRGRDGYLRVLYDKLGLKFQTYHQWLQSGGHRALAVAQ